MRFNDLTIAFAVLAIETPVCYSTSAVAPASGCPSSLRPREIDIFEDDPITYIQGLKLDESTFPLGKIMDMVFRMVTFGYGDRGIEGLFVLSSMKAAHDLHAWGVLNRGTFVALEIKLLDKKHLQSESFPYSREFRETRNFFRSGFINFLALPLRVAGYSAECPPIGLDNMEELSLFQTDRETYLKSHLLVPEHLRESISQLLNRLNNEDVDTLFLLCSKKVAGDEKLFRKWNTLLSLSSRLAKGLHVESVTEHFIRYTMESVRERLIGLLVDAYTIGEYPLAISAAAGGEVLSPKMSLVRVVESTPDELSVFRANRDDYMNRFELAGKNVSQDRMAEKLIEWNDPEIDALFLKCAQKADTSDLLWGVIQNGILLFPHITPEAAKEKMNRFLKS